MGCVETVLVMKSVSFTVVGLPKPQGSKRHVGNGVMVESAGAPLRDWRGQVAFEAQAQMMRVGTMDGPIGVELGFVLPRPKSARTGELWAWKRPDLDKLARAVLDALTSGGLIVDDARIVSMGLTKRLSDPVAPWTGCVVRVSESIEMKP